MKKILVILFCSYFGFSQDLPNIIAPSPEAASLAKFTEVPVSLYTGVPNISIPIYTIQQSGISVPISLNYHARGIKVEEIASRVGLGWALSYGGSISRQTRGKVDEDLHGYATNTLDSTFLLNQVRRTQILNTYTFNTDYDFIPDSTLSYDLR